MVFCTEVALKSRQRCQMLDVTGEIQDAIKHAGIGAGICLVSSLHTTAGMTVNENADPDVVRDILSKLERLVPHSDSYQHSEGNSDAHVKASLTGLSVQLPIRSGRLVLGTWQSVYFCEFDGPRSRTISVTCLGE